MICHNTWQQRVVVEEELVQQNYDYKALFMRTGTYKKNIPKEFTRRIYKKLQEKNKKRKENFLTQR